MILPRGEFVDLGEHGGFYVPTSYQESPSPFVRHAANYLKPGSKILDVGAAWGGNSIYLATLGHDVTAVELHHEITERGERLVRNIGSSAIKHRFVAGDMRYIEAEPDTFDAVVATHSLQEISPSDAPQLIDRLQLMTKTGGLHLISAYTTYADELYKVPTKALFTEISLLQLYAGWGKVEFEAKPQPLVRSLRFPGKWEFSGSTNLIAQKTK